MLLLFMCLAENQILTDHVIVQCVFVVDSTIPNTRSTHMLIRIVDDL